jgi:hypothetical protein
MRYTLLLYYPERTADELGPEALAEGMRAFQAYAKALEDAGVLASAEVLQQSNAIEVPDLDAGIEWARRAPSASWGHVEVRPTATRYLNGSWQGAQPAG